MDRSLFFIASSPRFIFFFPTLEEKLLFSFSNIVLEKFSVKHPSPSFFEVCFKPTICNTEIKEGLIHNCSAVALTLGKDKSGCKCLCCACNFSATSSL